MFTRFVFAAMAVLLAASSQAGAADLNRQLPSPTQVVFQGPGVPGDGTAQQIYGFDLDGSHFQQFTNDGHDHHLAHFSPDGTRLVYGTFYKGNYGDPHPTTDVTLFSFATGHQTRLTHTRSSMNPVWSPDGTHIAYTSYSGNGLWVMNADGSNQILIGTPSGALNDLHWADIAWSVDNWILFTVAQNTNNCFKSRVDKMRPDGTHRTMVSQGGTVCTPQGMENYGDSDPSFSVDGKTIYSSRGIGPLPADPTQTLRHLYSFSSAAWFQGKVENDLSAALVPDCKVGVPKNSPDGTQIFVFLFCPSNPDQVGVTLTDTLGSYWDYVAGGFGADWNPAWKP